MIHEMPTCSFKYIVRTPAGGNPPESFSESASRKAVRFHRRLPGYAPTPLVRLNRLARSWGVAEVRVKDESARFGLGAFKVLGGSYAVARLLCRKLGVDIDDVAFDDLVSEDARRRIGRITLAAATDGNHGRGVAWAAERFKQNAIIFMPRGAAPSRVAHIRSHGAAVETTDLNYDEAVRLCCRMAEENGWDIVQDTAWEGYTDIPRWIMQGYTTLCSETLSQMSQTGAGRPTHVFLQAGVGGFAGAVVGYLANRFPDDPPRFIIVEPKNAACIFASVAAGDGRPHAVSGNLATIMAGLSCGEPNPIAWEILRNFASGCISCDDFVATNGVRILANPLEDDAAVEAGESGAVGIGLVDLLMRHPDFQKVKRALAIGPGSSLLFFNTEGATDPENYRDIVWYGKYPSAK